MVHHLDTGEDILSAGCFRGLVNPHEFPRELRAAGRGREWDSFR